MLEKHSSVPLHIQLTDLLRKQITSNELEPLARMPSERELCDAYGVSRITVRKATCALQNEGLIYTTVGKGTFVAMHSLEEELKPLNSFTQDLERRGMKASSRVLGARILNADDEQALHLRLLPGAEVVWLRRLRLADDAPVALQQTCLPHHRCPGILQFDLSVRSLFDVLRKEYRLALAYADTSIVAALASPEECKLLGIESPAAVLVTDQTTYLPDNTIIEIAHSVFRGDKYTLHTRA